MICNKLQKEIWESGGNITGLTDSCRQHLEVCQSCQDELRLVQATVEAFAAIDVPDSWDCKSYVNGQISSIPVRRRGLAPVYATAVVACLLAVVSWSNFSEVISPEKPAMTYAPAEPNKPDDSPVNPSGDNTRTVAPDTNQISPPEQQPRKSRPVIALTPDARPKAKSGKGVSIASAAVAANRPASQPGRMIAKTDLYESDHSINRYGIASAPVDTPMTVAANPAAREAYYSESTAMSNFNVSGGADLKAVDRLETVSKDDKEPAVLSWSAEGDSDMSYDISVTNPETGKITRSYGRRTGNVITVNSGVVSDSSSITAGDEGRM